MIRGEHSSITCPVTGSLDGLQIYWMDDQSIISNNSVLNIDTENEQFKEKNFTCVSENAFGKDSQLIVAQIIGEMVTHKHFEKEFLLMLLFVIR